MKKLFLTLAIPLAFMYSTNAKSQTLAECQLQGATSCETGWVNPISGLTKLSVVGAITLPRWTGVVTAYPTTVSLINCSRVVVYSSKLGTTQWFNTYVTESPGIKAKVDLGDLSWWEAFEISRNKNNMKAYTAVGKV